MAATILGCGGANTISTVYRDGYFSEGFSMVLGADGNPLIAHNDGDPWSLRVVDCDQPDCAGTKTTATIGNRGGYGSSIVVGADGNAIISYFTYEDVETGDGYESRVAHVSLCDGSLLEGAARSC